MLTYGAARSSMLAATDPPQQTAADRSGPQRTRTEEPAIATPLNLRELARLRVLETVQAATVTSRSELVTLTGLSRGTVSSIVADLVAAGVVREEPPSDDPGPGARSGGRPVRPLTLAPGAAYAVGADIGRRHLRVGVCDLRGALVWQHAEPLEVDGRPHEVLDRIAELTRTGLAAAGIHADRVLGLGAAVAAPVRKGGEQLEAAGIMPGWPDIRLGDELAARTGLLTRVDNDANAGALGELLFGAGRNRRDFLYVRFSAGLGAGLVVGGVPLLGTDGLAGEIGHVVVRPDGRICRCGRRGCLETVAGPLAVCRLLSESWGRPVDLHELPALLEARDPGAVRAVQDAAEDIGRVLASLVTVLNPELIVLGGELAAFGEVVLPPMDAAVRRGALPPAAERLRLCPGELGQTAEVRGAAGLLLTEAPRLLAARAS